MAERRIEPRLLCADLVDVHWKDELGSKCRATGVLEDISRYGACLQLDTPIPLDSDLRIAAPRARLNGRVCYCFFREIGYSVGVQFGRRGKWLKRNYVPEHLLDPRSMIGSGRGATRH